MVSQIKRGDIVDVSLDPTVGSEMMKTRPCVVVQNDAANKYSRLTVIVPATDAQKAKDKIPPVWVRAPKGNGFAKDSLILCDQIRSVDKIRIGAYRGTLSAAILDEVNQALKIALALS